MHALLKLASPTRLSTDLLITYLGAFPKPRSRDQMYPPRKLPRQTRLKVHM